MHEVLNGVYLRNFLGIGVFFREEYNEPSSTMIDYSDATITAPNYPIIVRSNTLLATAHATVP